MKPNPKRMRARDIQIGSLTRRDMIKTTGAGALALAWPDPAMTQKNTPPKPLFRISLAQWSLHLTIEEGKLDNLDFAKVAMEDYGIEAIEYVSQFFQDKAEDRNYLKQMKQRADDLGVKNVLIMIDEVGALGAADDSTRKQAIEGHYPWVVAAKFLGCHCIRVNAASEGTFQEQQQRAADGLRRLTEFAAEQDMSVTVENHGGLSSNGAWLSGVMKLVDHPRCGTLPDFGNFRIQGDEWYDRYKGVAELMPYAKAVSAKSHDFDEDGNETGTDYRRMMKIVLDAGYHGYVGIEYEGDMHSEPDGIRLTKALLETVRQEMAAEPPATSPSR